MEAREQGAGSLSKDGPITELLSDLDSHGIYDLGYITSRLREAGYTDSVPVGMTQKEIERAIDARGLGGIIPPEDYPGQRFVAGYEVSNHVARSMGVSGGGDMYSGRGRRHMAYIAAVREAEAGS